MLQTLELISYFCGLFNDASLSKTTERQIMDGWWKIKWKEFGRKRWPEQYTFPKGKFRHWVKTRKTSVSTVSTRAEFRMGFFRINAVEHYRFASSCSDTELEGLFENICQESAFRHWNSDTDWRKKSSDIQKKSIFEFKLIELKD